MASLPPYGWRVPLNTDRPGGGRQIRELAEDVAATVEAGTVRAYSGTKRTATATYQANTYGAVSGAVSVAAAPPGVYDISWLALWAKAAGPGSPVQVRVTVNSVVVLEGTITETTDSFRRIASGSLKHVQAAAGALNVSVEIRGVLAPVDVFEGSRVDVARVSI